MKKTFIFYFLSLILINQAAPLRGTENSFSEEESFLVGRLKKQDKRYPTFLLALQLLKELKAKTLVETGTARNGDQNFWGDGGSTIIFADWASKNNALLHSVDISPLAIQYAKAASAPYKDNIQFTVGDSITFLKNFNKPIDFLYLDSFDFELDNPFPSQNHHLKELIAAYSKLHDKTVIMIDDCDLPHGGKGKLAIEFLTKKGWIVLHSGYQVILVSNKF
ncbi:class I SAM-dependent methyltransferase [Criblamydia sequanensis]|uniref:Secreted protein n=1 Tax=Candidatus Criblamydia sequanensis CRIB-18 TaxID=1437425 RepID=A0A090CXY8_9BACT|nr:class I SAM-dependent methyltransferase [Criblamydia sequanensis]CDR33137.1 hypothetical protein CSEC_0298 [Criblamydia sequanensis CRIB-18]